MIISTERRKEFFSREDSEMAAKLNIVKIYISNAQIFIKNFPCFFIIELLFYDRSLWKNNFDVFFKTQMGTYKAYEYTASFPISFLVVNV